MIYQPDFDRDLARGAQAELFVDDVCKILAQQTARVEIKSDAWFVHRNRFYVERECCGRDNTWRPSGIQTTKAALWIFKFGRHPGALIFETDWLRRATDMAAKDARNHAECFQGSNPTRGVFVYLNHLLHTRDCALDEHSRK